MGSKTVATFFVIVMIAVIVGSDIAFFRHHTLERLLANVGIVLVFVAVYLTYFRRR